MKKIILYSLVLVVVVSMALVCGAEEKSAPVALVNKYPVPPMKYKEPSLYADFTDNHVFERLEKALMFSKGVKALLNIDVEADGVNQYDEVPDSPFFTNRNSKERMSLKDIKKGADVNKGPDTSKPWVVYKGKSAGRSPGFYFKDSRGDRYLIKLDRKQYPEMLSSVEVISSKLFHAMGYNVPQYTVCRFKPDILTVDEDARFYDDDGFEKQLTRERLLEMMQETAYRDAQGNYRGSASKFLDGVPLGYMSFHSSRTEDKLDQIPHEHRREIRGYKVVSSWLNNHDARRGNSLDMIIEEEDGWYLKHYLIDFGSCLGSHNMRYKYPEAGHTYAVDMWESIAAWVTLGLYKRPYYGEVKSFSPAVGNITSGHFRPGRWKPLMPNYAFDNMTTRDAFWAAKIVMSFTDEQIRAAVEIGELSSQRDQDYLTKVLIERRDKVGQYWFTKINPLDNFSLNKTGKGYELRFENLYKKYNFARSGDIHGYTCTIYEVQDNGEKVKKGEYEFQNESVLLPSSQLDARTHSLLSIQTHGKYRQWRKATSVTVDTNKRIVGVDRPA